MHVSTKRQIVESSGIYFITITCYEWLPLFELTNGYDIVYFPAESPVSGTPPPLPVFFTGNFAACLLVKNTNRGEGNRLFDYTRSPRGGRLRLEGGKRKDL